MVAEIVHGAPYRFQDPARFSLAHGGKDRQPFPVPIGVYDETIRVIARLESDRLAISGEHKKPRPVPGLLDLFI